MLESKKDKKQNRITFIQLHKHKRF